MHQANKTPTGEIQNMNGWVAFRRFKRCVGDGRKSPGRLLFR